MSAEAKMKSDPFEELKRTLEDAPRDYDFLADYVRELELRRKEEDIFLHLAFRNASAGGAFPSRGDRPFIVSVVSELYDPLNSERKLAIRQLWHEKVRREADQFDDLKHRLSKLT